MTRSILNVLTAAGHRVTRGIAVVALVTIWGTGQVGTYAFAVAGITTAAITGSSTAANAQWWWGRRGWGGGWGRRGWGGGWGRRGWGGWGRRGWRRW